MQSQIQTAPVSKVALWTGRIVSGLLAFLLFVDGVAKLFKPAPVVEGTIRLGYPESSIIPLGIVLLISVVLYVVPRTAVIGAILLTSYLGGAVATHVRAQEGAFPIFFPVVVGALLWGGLVLRDPGLRVILPVQR